MPFNKIQIISSGLEILGKGPITAISTKLEEAGERAYNLLYSSDIGSSSYSFATRWAQLSKTTGIPINKRWQFEYSLPSDYVKMVELSPNTDYDIIEDKTLLSNQTELQAKYVFIPAPEFLPDYYVRFLAYSIANWLAKGVLGNASLAKELKQDMVTAKNVAQSQNAQSKPNPFKKSARYISARY